jgi:hypothetical protein
MPRGNGRFVSCSGTTTSTATAASATSRQHSAMPARIAFCSTLATRSVKVRANATHGAGAGDPKLDAGRRGHAQPRAQYGCPSGSIANPAFRFDRRTCFPVPTWQRPRHGAQRRGREEQSHPEPRAAPRAWRAPDLPRSEHRSILSISRTPAHQRQAERAGRIG